MKTVRSLLVLAGLVAATLLTATPAGAGGGCHLTTFTDEAGSKVSLTEACFAPTVLRVQPGQKITWTNDDGITHTVTGALARWGTYDELTPGKSVSYRFPTAGVFPYFCAFHPGMVGAVVVGDGGTAAGTQGAAPVIVPQSQTPPPAAPATEAAKAQPASNASNSAWRTIALAAIGLLAIVGALLGLQRFGLRRSRLEVKAG